MSVYGDWGSTRLRLWRVQAGRIADRREGPGIVGLERPPFDVLHDALSSWRLGADEQIILCGMAGARGGLHEVPYIECPCDRTTWRNQTPRLALGPNRLRIAAGLACRIDGRPDVLRGEETQAFGAIQLRPDLARGRKVLVLPGTHSKWAVVEDGVVRHFQTFPTGEMFSLLQRSSMAGAAEASGDSAEQEGFEAGLGRAEAQSGLLGSLFEARAAQVRDGRSASWTRGFLSGLVLGSEAVEVRRAGRLPDQVAIVGNLALAERYARVLGRFGVVTETLDGEACALAGLELLDDDN